VIIIESMKIMAEILGNNKKKAIARKLREKVMQQV
jgi:hypothetical protein